MNTQRRQFEALINRHLGTTTPHIEYVLASPDGDTVLLPMQKNASSFVWKWALENGWAGRKTGSLEPKYFAMVLRDPISRWKSGIVQFLHQSLVRKQGYTDEQLEREWTGIVSVLIKNGPALFDIHTWPQHYWHVDLYPGVPRIYFKFEDKLNFTLAKTFKWNMPSDELRSDAPGYGNVGRQNSGKIKLLEMIDDLIERDPEMIQILRDVFKEDIDIYNSAPYTVQDITRRDRRTGVSFDDFEE